MPKTNFLFAFQKIANYNSAIEDFLKRCFDSLSCIVSEPKLGELLTTYQVQETETYIETIERVVNTKILLYEAQGVSLYATHSLNDPQEKVVNYAYCFLVLESHRATLSIHWGNFVSELRIASLLTANLNVKNTAEAIELFDYYHQPLKTITEGLFDDISLLQTTTLKQLLLLCEVSNAAQDAIAYKSAPEIVQHWEIDGILWKVLQMIDYDGMYIDKNRILVANCLDSPLNYQVFTKWDLKETAISLYFSHFPAHWLAEVTTLLNARVF